MLLLQDPGSGPSGNGGSKPSLTPVPEDLTLLALTGTEPTARDTHTNKQANTYKKEEKQTPNTYQYLDSLPMNCTIVLRVITVEQRQDCFKNCVES